ncbi:MAG: arginine--tRNA ligase [Candidatus Micrarchaeota archaeon]|nr:arginine--tRNA ligase [Candidatus Micrarchaeota archaeon]
MNSPSRDAKSEFERIIDDAILSAYGKVDFERKMLGDTIKYASSEFGDLSCSISFALARSLRKDPRKIAAEIAKHAKAGRLVAEIGAESGYINARLDRASYGSAVIERIAAMKKDYGRSEIGKGHRVFVESPSVNPNKPWHVGHLRNAILGSVISNLLEFCSYDVERENYIDDLGLQVAESVWGYMHMGNEPDKKFDTWLGEQYVMVNKRMSEKAAVKEEINHLVKRMEAGGTDEAKTAREIAEKCVAAQYETASMYGICHDILVWESDIVSEKLLEKALSVADKAGMLEKPKEGKYAGCVTINLDKVKELAKDFENPLEDTKVLVRSNGTATYVAKDFAFHMWKFGIIEDTFKYRTFIRKQVDGGELRTTSPSGERKRLGPADSVINIIDDRQRYPQLILKAAFKLLGYPEISSSIVHLSYGTVGVSGGSLSGRKGGWMGEDGRSYTADYLLEEVSKKAAEIVGNSKKVTDTSKVGEIARAIALGAIKFDFVSVAPEKDMLFSWERALKFEGDTGPYCIYTYARATRLLEKAGPAEHKLVEKDYSALGAGEFAVIKLLSVADEMVEKACRERRPNILTDYLLELCTAFSKFYEAVPVIGSGEAERARLAVVSSTRQTIGNMLLLLGIKPLERM